eukprot:GHVR01010430.1.p1 GENE.GHVR01010430.1~~GHVR01010430.1.p1  ORF type:complete len:147 (-),score=47.96 GHVR01010430.1:19-459(-)
MCVVLRGEAYTHAADVFSLGVFFWEMFAREIPHDGVSPLSLITQIGYGPLSLQIPPPHNKPNSLVCPSGVCDIIQRCIDCDPSRRPSANDVWVHMCELYKCVSLDVESQMFIFTGDFCWNNNRCNNNNNIINNINNTHNILLNNGI